MCLIAQEAAVRNTIREEMGTYRTSPAGPTVCQEPPEFPWMNLVTRVIIVIILIISQRGNVAQKFSSRKARMQEVMGRGVGETVASERRREVLLTLLTFNGEKISAPREMGFSLMKR